MTPQPPAGGYLAQVVERVLPTEPTLQRRQPALFEPVQPEAAVDALDAADEAGVASPASRWREDAAVSLPPRARLAEAVLPFPPVPARPAQIAAAEAMVGPPAPQRAEALIAEERKSSVPHEPPVIDTTIRVETANLPMRAAPVLIPPAAAPVPPAAAHRGDAPGAAEPAPIPQRVPLSATGGALSQPPYDLAALSAGSARPLPGDPRAEAAVPAAPRPSPAVTPAMPPRAALRAAVQTAVRPAGPRLARELPPVEVTIGRVEVRAFEAPANTLRSQRTAPRLSLDEYLRERNGGGR